jgi:hypothetical protein
MIKKTINIYICVFCVSECSEVTKLRDIETHCQASEGRQKDFTDMGNDISYARNCCINTLYRISYKKYCIQAFLKSFLNSNDLYTTNMNKSHRIYYKEPLNVASRI